jgi:hypothetical protein
MVAAIPRDKFEAVAGRFAFLSWARSCERFHLYEAFHDLNWPRTRHADGGDSIDPELLSRRVRDGRSNSQHCRRAGLSHLSVGTRRSTGWRYRRPDPKDAAAAACPTRAGASVADAKHSQPGPCPTGDPSAAWAEHGKFGSSNPCPREFRAGKPYPAKPRFRQHYSGKHDPTEPSSRDPRSGKTASAETSVIEPTRRAVQQRSIRAASSVSAKGYGVTQWRADPASSA